MKTCRLLALWATTAFFLPGCGMLHVPARNELERVPSVSVSRTKTPPAIDGSLDDPCWTSAAKISGFRPCLEPRSPIPYNPTSVRMLWDAKFLYVSFECSGSEIFFTRNRKHDDALFEEEVCEVFLDGVGDGRQYVEVQVNPDGVNLDAIHFLTMPPKYTSQMRLTGEFCNADRWLFKEWEMEGLKTAGRLTSSGWSAEIAIPAAAVMKRKGSSVFFPTQLRANFVRYEHPFSKAARKREFVMQSWSTVLFGCPHISPARMGFLKLRGEETR